MAVLDKGNADHRAIAGTVVEKLRDLKAYDSTIRQMLPEFEEGLFSQHFIDEINREATRLGLVA